MGYKGTFLGLILILSGSLKSQNQNLSETSTMMYAYLIQEKDFMFMVDLPIRLWGKIKRLFARKKGLIKDDPLRRRIEAFSHQPDLTDQFFLGTEMEKRMLHHQAFLITLVPLKGRSTLVAPDGKRSKLYYHLREDVQNRIRLKTMYEFFTSCSIS